jgi:serine/threonine-protein kinase
VVDGPDPLLGKKIAGRYTVMRRIARGGMGVVYLAVQEGLGRAVALKIIRREAAADPIMQKRFEREAKAASQLSHPCIVTVHDFGRTDEGELFLAMEFVDGEPLRDVLKRKKRLLFSETLPIVESICYALVRAHAAGVVHRDLKPENIMLPRMSASAAGSAVAKVLDFGLAKPHDQDQVEENLTRDGGFVGTPGYAAPEQTEGAPEHPRQDLYALGVVWFEMLQGAHPFAAPTPMKVVVRQLNEEPPSPEGMDAPPQAAALIRSLLARRPEGRPDSAQAVLDALKLLSSPPTSTPGEALSFSGAETVDAVAPAAPAAPAADAPLAAVPHTSDSLRVRRGNRSVVWLGAALAAGVTGFVVIYGVSGGFAASDAADAGAPLSVDAGAAAAADRYVPPPRLFPVDVVVEGLPSFRALAAMRQTLPVSELVSYSPAMSVLGVDVDSAAPIAEAWQGRALEHPVPLVLEVKELTPRRVVFVVVAPEDASQLVDGGVLKDGGTLPDSGTAEVPGGLGP